jgi:hypothetical protein
MPTVFRAMFPDGDRPRVGTGKNELGVRLPSDPHADVQPNAAGEVEPGPRGMSVCRSWREMPFFLVPKRLRPLLAGARGNNALVVFRTGDGPFQSAPMTEDLHLTLDKPHHGLVGPARVMTTAAYLAALAATCDAWVRDEA